MTWCGMRAAPAGGDVGWQNCCLESGCGRSLSRPQIVDAETFREVLALHASDSPLSLGGLSVASYPKVDGSHNNKGLIRLCAPSHWVLSAI